MSIAQVDDSGIKTDLDRGLGRLRRGLLDPKTAAQPEGERLAAVLVPIFERSGDLHLLYILRSDHVSHRGQVAFPGGRVDPEDQSPMAAALRETHEEVGIEPAAVEVLGAFPGMRTATSGIMVAPFAGLIPWPTTLRANPHEVAEIFSVPMAVLRDTRYRQTYIWQRDGLEWRFPAIVYDNRPIWGLTYRITMSLIETMERGRQPIA
ncbi:MAG TPA: CoA pyrophosphatase [Candidatus Binataceae bacterium]|nr:CoA pyrophosphatase [Candidatus Binataceae bacterium]